MNIIPIIDKTDEHGKKIVWEQGDYSIAVNSLPIPSYITLWYQGERMGSFYVDIINKSGEKWYKVSSIHINNNHKGKGLGKKMYQVLLSIPNEIKGIYSYLPDRSNKKQVPAIYNSLGGYVKDGDYAYIPKLKESKTMNNFEKSLVTLQEKCEDKKCKDDKDVSGSDVDMKKKIKELKRSITNHDSNSKEYKKIDTTIKELEAMLKKCCCK